MISKDYTRKLRDHHRSALFDDIVPWWEKHSVDLKNGGYLTRLERDGYAYSEDKDICRITVSKVYKNIRPEQQFENDITLSIESVLQRHWKLQHNCLLENVAMDGAPMFDLPEGRMFHPGHAIESAWMIMEVALENNNKKLMDTAIDISIASMEQGRDKEYGEWFGYLSRDGSPVWTAKANGWKGFFHLPRIFFRYYQLLSKQ
jgi:mannose/cellobiose epimerase-like protein (N-acyl-D-glucosamine 2-epimerase family)